MSGVMKTCVVKFIRKGVGITNTDVEYADSTSSTVAPTAGWQTNAPAWQNGHFIWTRTKITYSDGTYTYSNPVCIPSGKGIASIVEQYYKSTSATELVGGSWQETAPTWENGKYIWTRSKITYTDGSTDYTEAINATGAKGDTGVAISSVTEYYLATSASSGVTTSTSGWTTNVQSVTATNKYLWNYEVIAYTDNTTQTTTPVIIGTYGDTGVGISSITEYYLATSASSGVTTSTSGWTTNVQSVTATKKYLWNYEVVTYTDNTTQTTTPVIIGVYGDKGDQGDPGISISSVTEYYLATSASSGVTTSTSGWTTNVQSLTATKKYLWNYEKINYSNGTNTTTTPVIIGTYGDTGVGISSITEYYLATSASSGVTTSTSGWTTNVQSVTATKKYLWNYEVVTYTDNTTQTTTPVIIGVYGDKGDQGDPGGTGPQGPRGYRGPALRGPQEWTQLDNGYTFYKGDPDTQEPFEDVVIYNGNFYKCTKTHNKSSSNYPGSSTANSTGLWVLSDKLAMVAADVMFAEHGYFGSAIISGDWMLSTNGTIDGTAYNDGATYQSIVAYLLFNPNKPLGGDISKVNDSVTRTITANGTTNIASYVYLEAGRVYYMSATGYTNGTFYVRARYMSDSYYTYAPVMINSSSSVTRTGYIKPTVTGYYYVEGYNTTSSAGTTTKVTLVEKTFAPNYCVDLLTGKTYQEDAYVKGQIVATSGNITGTLTVGTYGAGVNSIRIVPDTSNPSIVGYVGTTEVFRLGTQVNYDGSINPTVKVGRSYLRENGLYVLDADGSNCRAYATRFIVERVVNSLHYPFMIDVGSNKKVTVGPNGKAMWPTSKSEVGYGKIYVDGTTLKVNMDG